CVLSLFRLLRPISLSVLSLSLHSAPPVIFTLSLHDALPICFDFGRRRAGCVSSLPARFSTLGTIQLDVASAPERPRRRSGTVPRSEEHTSELQSRFDLVCRLLLEKKKN